MDENDLPSYPPALDFATINDWTHSTGRHFEELQGACLGMAAEIDRLRRIESAARNLIAQRRDNIAAQKQLARAIIEGEGKVDVNRHDYPLSRRYPIPACVRRTAPDERQEKSLHPA